MKLLIAGFVFAVFSTVAVSVGFALWDGRYRDISDRSAGVYAAEARFFLGEHERGIKMLEDLHRPSVAGRTSDAARASLLAALGRKEEAEAVLKPILTMAYRDHHTSYYLGVAFAQLGNRADVSISQFDYRRILTRGR